MSEVLFNRSEQAKFTLEKIEKIVIRKDCNLEIDMFSMH